MVLVLKSLIVVALGVALGLAGTYMAVERSLGFGAIHAGAWTGWPKAGAREADPYSRATRSRSGEMPLGLTEGVSFIAKNDDQGAPLDPACEFTIGGATPTARFWTLTALTPEGRLIDTKTRKHGFTSSEVTRDGAGDFFIQVATQARPGNWLPIAPGQPFVLLLRLYDTVLSASSNALDASLMPSVKRGRCA